MLILGVDIAKLNHVASLVDSNSNEIIFSNFKFQNNFNGFSSLKLELEKFNIDEVFILLESTGHYGENFTAFFFSFLLILQGGHRKEQIACLSLNIIFKDITVFVKPRLP